MQKLLYNVTGQTLFFDCPEGRPSSVTSVAVYASTTGDDGTAESATTGSAAVETNPNTTFDAASGDGQTDPSRLWLTATTGIELGRRYRATNANSEWEWVEVIDVESGASVQARHELVNSYAVSDTFESTRISISILDSWIQDETNLGDDNDPNPEYRVRWEYVVDSVIYVHETYFTVARYRAEHDVEPQDIDERYSGWIDRLPTEHRQDQGRRLIDKAYKTLSFDLHRLDIPQEMMRNREVVNELTELKAIMMTESATAKRTGDTIGYEIARSEYQAALDGLVASGKTDIATDSSGAASKIDTRSLWSK